MQVKDLGLADTAAAKCISIADDLIADFTTDNRLSPAGGRVGLFYVYGDGSLAGKLDPPPSQPYPIDTTTGNPECSGPGSLHVKGTGWGVFGAAIGADFNFMPTDAVAFRGSYDASKYRGISFWAKAAAPLNKVQVSILDVFTDGLATFEGLPGAPDGGITSCVYAPDPKSNCSPYLVKIGDFGFPKYLSYQIDTTWKRFDIFFADTVQDQFNAGFHTAADKLDTSHVTAMTIQVNADFSSGTPVPNDFEIWVDDVNFIK